MRQHILQTQTHYYLPGEDKANIHPSMFRSAFGLHQLLTYW